MTVFGSTADRVPVTVWSPESLSREDPGGLLLVQDGPEYGLYGSVTRYVTDGMATGLLPPLRLALLHPVHREDWYPGSPAYLETLTGPVPDRLIGRYAVGHRLPSSGLPRRSHRSARRDHPHPDCGRAPDRCRLRAVRLVPHHAHRPQERRFPYFDRVAASVTAVRARPAGGRPLVIGLTCGALEKNALNNRSMAEALHRAGHAVTYREVPDLHTYTAWRDSLDPTLTEVLTTLWGPRRVATLAGPACDHYSLTMHFQGRVTQRRMTVTSGPRDLQVIRYGHFGRPLLMFPSEAGQAWQPADFGLIDAIAPLIDAGRVTVFSVDTLDDWTWSAYDVPTEERAHRHGIYQRWITDSVVAWIYDELGGPTDILTTGVSMGAYHAVQLALSRADLFPLAIAMSGNYDPASFRGFGELGDQTYFANPMSYVPNLHGDHLEWLRSRLSLLLVVGRGPFEWDPTRALPGTLEFAEVLADKGIPHELDVWGDESAHDWPWWHRQLAHHLPRFV